MVAVSAPRASWPSKRMAADTPTSSRNMREGRPPIRRIHHQSSPLLAQGAGHESKACHWIMKMTARPRSQSMASMRGRAAGFSATGPQYQGASQRRHRTRRLAPMTHDLVKLAYSVDADDAFMFHALEAGRIDTRGLRFQHRRGDTAQL